ncbi:MAG: hypothetical protein M1814_003370 [Vezdaea aestivalis]|nr:MAG: hypothetical protein M1814_003370 [Vezdaea aestivalis]
MAKSCLLVAAAAVALTSLPATSAFYTKSSPVLQLDGKGYDKLIARSNYTSMVEFYAPWCGHCQSLKPAYEKAAKNLAGLAKVAAVNCDEESNKAFCGTMGVQGFPTLKIIKPGKKPGKPIVEDYQGARSAKGIVDAVTDKITNHVKKVNDKDYQKWAQDLGAKAILFTEKGTTSALLKSLAIDFLGSIKFAQVRDTQSVTVSQFEVSSFPTLVVVSADSSEPITYDGEMKKAPMLEFLSKYADPNPDASSKGPKDGKPAKKFSKKASGKAKEASASEATKDATGATSVVLEDEQPSESPDPQVSPDAPKPEKVVDLPPPVPELPTGALLQKACLGSKTTTCILALVPHPESMSPSVVASAQALAALAEIAQNYATRKARLFPFYSVPAANPSGETLRIALNLNADPDVEIIAVNTRRGWWRRYMGKPSLQEIENWIDTIRLGEGEKHKLPADIVPKEEEVPEEPVQVPIKDPDHDEL